jgi:hypothetical protein
MNTKNTIALAMLILTSLSFTSCKKDSQDSREVVIPFEPTSHFIAGTITPKNGSYKSVFFIKLLEANKAVFVSSGNDFSGDYNLTKDSLIVTVSDPNNYRIAKFAINSDHQLTSAYYRALTTEYGATGQLLKIETTNQLLGKTFKGEEFKLGAVSNRKDFIYKFGPSALTYGSGLDAAAINSATNTYELINGSAFKYKSGTTVELGFIANKKLTVFRSSGLFYYGDFLQQ